MAEEIQLLKGNEAIAEAAIRCGADAYFGYPITPQSEIIEYLAQEDPYNKRTGMVVLQAESEVAAINMVYGAASTGKKAMTSSSSPGMSLKQEGISYLAGAELPCLIVNVARGGPGLGTIQPSQADYFQTVKGGGHGDYNMIVLAPYTVQEQYDFVKLGFDLAFKYSNPVMILSDGAIGQMMEKVTLSAQVPRETKDYGWNVLGKSENRERRYITSLYLQSEVMEQKNLKIQAKYAEIRKNEIRYEEIQTDDADYILVAYGISARIARKVIRLARAEGIKVGMLRPITLWPFPSARLKELAPKVQGMLTVEMSAGQMIEDVRLAVEGAVPVKHYGRMGGIIASPTEVFINFKKLFNIA
ncbi:MAG: 3-methyl-2-oxobutanoate dehydrogenase subunit VorB [Bacteroidales bacterium]|jgi:2-oxoglutarate ferredoxin oxidoreductase subunit alpha|nr:3-methyl-2-oxobutanoate dehydrogenase subunit VorB [Bacteroidales bacterium]